MATVVDACHGGTHPIYNASIRCFGFCPEEQMMLQMRARGLELSPLPIPPWNVSYASHVDLFKVDGAQLVLRESQLLRNHGMRACSEAALGVAGHKFV